jgi:hypothetical protein
MYQRSAAETYEAAKATALALREREQQDRAATLELAHREASCPRCKARNPDPCIEKGADGVWRELDRCHWHRRKRWADGW